jgi:uncharacterized protein DUF2452
MTGAPARERVSNENPVTSTTQHKKNPNPQGKGLVPVLRDWDAMQPGTAVVKAPDALLRDYCISSLVLGAKFQFKPIVGKPYYLYAREDDWTMSLIAPDEWGERQPGACLGRCRLRVDMTWEIEAIAGHKVDEVAQERAQEFVRNFVDTLSGQEALGEHLPFYVQELPYYQRLLATALAASLQRSLPAVGNDVQARLGGMRDWLLSSGESATP